MLLSWFLLFAGGLLVAGVVPELLRWLCG